jgi:N-acetylglucosaminyldiphosphoundecaprenol N-acetyl-beta-D-mannosaminyltransferase
MTRTRTDLSHTDTCDYTRAEASTEGVARTLASSDTRIPSGHVLGTRVHAVNLEDAAKTIIEWAITRSSKVVCAANVHMIMEAYDQASFREQLNTADIALPDGAPLAWTLRRQGYSEQRRVPGPDLIPKLCSLAARANIAVGIYGGRPATAERAARRLTSLNPSLRLPLVMSPPFRTLTHEEHDVVVHQINASGVRILFVALGCPKQEMWMFKNRHTINAVMVGIGAGLDFIAGDVRRAPHWMQKCGLEWCHRLLQEPRRLWRRYLLLSPRFVGASFMQLCK